jgi:hypothetical protein
MTQPFESSHWISAYLEWTDTDPGMGRPPALTGADSDAFGNDDLAAVYLEWIDAAPVRDRRARAPVSRSSLREAALLMVLRTESECAHILRQALEDDKSTSQAMQLAMEALDKIETDVRGLSGRILELRAH